MVVYKRTLMPKKSLVRSDFLLFNFFVGVSGQFIIYCYISILALRLHTGGRNHLIGYDFTL